MEDVKTKTMNKCIDKLFYQCLDKKTRKMYVPHTSEDCIDLTRKRCRLLAELKNEMNSGDNTGEGFKSI